ncbi:MAG: methyltransferase domain-containing protein [Helicobacter sp.]|uniref:SAM-dependent methyltransferase n=1 Tax=Helicobacter sp. TaxID=218 RepID=UPI002A913900|nr:SAM-dependent methyltransferase [Helicobacter sp.]MDY5615464.1 methyltransferase domain-containing protein [Helicobacter sp.]
MLKATLQKTFLKAQNTYSKAATIQNKMQDILLEILTHHQKNSHFQNILELGCGRGGFSEKISNKLIYDNFIALDLIDFSQSFLDKNIEFLKFDIEDLEMIKNIYQNITFDLIASNAALQWTNQFKLLPKFNQLSNKNSLLLLGIFGKNNLWEMREFLGSGLEYLDTFKYKEILEKDWEILECFSILQTLHFSNPLEVFKHLKNTGVNVYTSSLTLTKTHLKSYEERFKNNLTYEPLYILAQKK